jgi:hypothetical protein
MVGFFFVSFISKPYFVSLITEWSIFIFLCISGVSYINFLTRPTFWRMVPFSLAVGSLAAIRLEFLIIIPISQLALWYQHWRFKLPCLIISLIFPALALTFNLLDQNRITVRELPKAGLFFLTAGLNFVDTPKQPGETTHEQDHLEEAMDIIKTRGERFSREDILRYAKLDPSGIFRVATHNEKLIEDYRVSKGLSNLEKCSLEGELAKRIIFSDISGYLILFAAGLMGLTSAVPLLILCKACGKKGDPFWQAVYFIGAVHVVRLTLVAGVNIMYSRYYVPTIVVVLLFAYLALLNSMTSKSNSGAPSTL